MLDKARNNLIKHAFQLAGITCPESEPTAAEIDDAAQVLNVMLQSWNNDGFRLFKIKRGYMPFVKGKNEYSLATEAYKSFDRANVNYFSKIGTSVLSLSSIANAAPRQKLIVVNNVVSSQMVIKSVGYQDASVLLQTPLDISVFNDDAVFYGSSFASCLTPKKYSSSVFNTLSFSGASVMPYVGDTVYFQYKGSDNKTEWLFAKITFVDTSNNTITINTSLSAGYITNGYIVYGTSFYFSKSTQDQALMYRSIELSNVPSDSVSLAVKRDNIVDDQMQIESINGNKIITTTAFNEDELRDFGVPYLKAENVRDPEDQVSWLDLVDVIPLDGPIDWGEVSDTTDIQTDDWGFVTDPNVDLEDWGTLTSTAVIKSFASTIDDAEKYVVAIGANNTNYLFYKAQNANWTAVDTTDYSLTEFRLVGFGNSVFLYDKTQGVFKLTSGSLESVYSATGTETMVQYKNMYYFLSAIVSGSTRNVTATADFVNFVTAWQVDLPTVGSPAEFDDKLFIGTNETFVTTNMRQFSNINVFAEGRCVVGDRILNLNHTQYCSFSKDGVNFMPMPLMFSTQSAWGYKDGCSFVAVYGVLMEDGTIGTEIYTTNDFNPVWLPKLRISGRVSDIFFNNSKAYFVSDVEVKSMTYYDDIAAEEVEVLLYGAQIGRPQEIMNVMKRGLTNEIQLPMNALALKDFLLLPQDKTNGEPVNYCFIREAEDGKMMVWGTPDKFGEYLRFTYVEPLTLLEDARSTPDFPDEYYEAVENGLAAELAYHYQLPVERIQALVAKAEAAKEMAMLHDNEDTSYNLVPNQRML